MPQTVEQKIVAAVDNLIQGTRRISVEEAEADFCAKVELQAALRVRSLHDEVFGSNDRFSHRRVENNGQ
jgi:hypothetical protein